MVEWSHVEEAKIWIFKWPLPLPTPPSQDLKIEKLIKKKPFQQQMEGALQLAPCPSEQARGD